jgi:hypothetical protein
MMHLTCPLELGATSLVGSDLIVYNLKSALRLMQPFDHHAADRPSLPVTCAPRTRFESCYRNARNVHLPLGAHKLEPFEFRTGHTR